MVNKKFNTDETRLNEDDAVEVITDNDGGGGDQWAIGKFGLVKSIDQDGYCEVELKGFGQDTFLFASYQLVKITD
jgi:hypothetical protein